jgi:hypothetical protein
MKIQWIHKLIFSFFLVAVTTNAFGQSEAIDGNIDGYVSTHDGTALSQAHIRITNVNTGFTRETDTNENGYYIVQLLPPGSYTVTASKADFSTVVKRNVVLIVGTQVRVDMSLAVGDVKTIVEVKSDDTGVEVDRTTAHSNVFTDREARNVTLSARNPLEFYTFDTILNSSRNSTGGSGTSTPSAVFAGATNGNSVDALYNVDGVTNNLQGGARDVVFSAEAISEYQVLVNPPAEFGRTTGPILNALSRSGTNNWHGSAYMFTKQKVLSARPYLMQPTVATQPFDRYNYGATISGPVIKNKAQFSLSYERWVQDNPISSTFGGAQQTVIGQEMGLPASEFLWTDTFRAHTVTAKGDIALNDRNRLALRYNMYNDHEVGTDSGQVTRHEAPGWDDKPMSGTAQLVTILKPTLLNEFRFLYAYRPVEEPTLSPNNPAVTISGVGTFNGNASGNYWYLESGYQVIDNLTWNKGRHSIKAGFDLLPDNWQDSTQNLNGTFTFSGISANKTTGAPAVSALQQYLNTIAGVINPATGMPYTYTQFTRSSGVLSYNATVINQGYFVQDDIRINPRLRVNAGLRYEMFVRPSGNLNPAFPLTGSMPQQYDELEPRIGVAWDPFGSGKTVVRAGYGIYHAAFEAASFDSWGRTNGISQRSISVVPTQAGAPVFTLGAVPAVTGGTTAVSNIDQYSQSSLKDLMTNSWDVSIEREIAPGLSVSGAYYGTYMTNLSYGSLGNLTAIGSLADGRVLFGGNSDRPNPSVGNVITVTTAGTWQNYEAFLVSVNKRLSHGLSLQAGYQYQYIRACNDKNIAMVNGGCFNKGIMSFEQPNRFTATAVWTPSVQLENRFVSGMVNGWLISNSTVIESGLPYSASSGADLNGDTNSGDRIIGGGYDVFRMPRYLELDFRLSRGFSLERFGRIEFFGEAANASDHANISGVNTTWGLGTTPNASFGTPTSVEIPRQFQLGFRYNY